MKRPYRPTVKQLCDDLDRLAEAHRRSVEEWIQARLDMIARQQQQKL